jgi:hypothetical protein
MIHELNLNLKNKLNNDYIILNNNINYLNNINIFGMKINYLSFIILMCGIILCIIDYTHTNFLYTTPLLFLECILLSISINCMINGNCYYLSYLYVLITILGTVYCLLNINNYNNIVKFIRYQ